MKRVCKFISMAALMNLLGCSALIIDQRVSIKGQKEYTYNPNEKFCGQIKKTQQAFYENFSQFSSIAYKNIFECSQKIKSEELAEPAYVYAKKYLELKEFWPKDTTIPEIESCFHGPYSYINYISDLDAYSHLVWVLISACSVKVEKRVLDKFYLREGKSTIKADDFIKSLELEKITSP